MDTQVKRSTSRAQSESEKYLSFNARNRYSNEFKEISQGVYINELEVEQDELEPCDFKLMSRWLMPIFELEFYFTCLNKSH